MALEVAFLERLAAAEGLNPRHLFDDQYLSNAAQPVLVALGTYRAVFDLRGLLRERLGALDAATSKPYDISGAVLCAQEAGCVVEAPDGAALDPPLDTSTPVTWVAYHHPALADRLRPHLRAVLGG